MIGKLTDLARVKLDAEIMCTLNEMSMGYIIEANQCVNNPDLLTDWYIVKAVIFSLRCIVDIYFACKLYQHIEKKYIETLPVSQRHVYEQTEITEVNETETSELEMADKLDSIKYH